MKKLILIALLLTSTGYADHYDDEEILSCRVTRMTDYTYFEEGLSPEEYPDIDVAISKEGIYSISYGGSVYQAEDNDQVQLTAGDDGIKVVTTTAHGDSILLTIERRTTLAKATIKVKETDRKLRTLGYAVCDRGIL